VPSVVGQHDMTSWGGAVVVMIPTHRHASRTMSLGWHAKARSMQGRRQGRAHPMMTCESWSWKRAVSTGAGQVKENSGREGMASDHSSTRPSGSPACVAWRGVVGWGWDSRVVVGGRIGGERRTHRRRPKRHWWWGCLCRPTRRRPQSLHTREGPQRHATRSRSLLHTPTSREPPLVHDAVT
jgi:hypothetical protein